MNDLHVCRPAAFRWRTVARCRRCRQSKANWNSKNAHVVAEASRRRFRVLIDRVSAIKLAAGCADCGYREHPAALDFDHAGSEKTANVSRLIRLSPWDRIAAEIAKCEVVCANCHRIRTFNERAR